MDERIPRLPALEKHVIEGFLSIGQEIRVCNQRDEAILKCSVRFWEPCFLKELCSAVLRGGTEHGQVLQVKEGEASKV